MQFNRYSENCSRTINRGGRRRLLGTSRSRMYCKTHVLELELQGVTWADNGQDCCRLVTRVRNLPINQHDRSRSPGTSERRARCCSWRPRRPQSPECWLQGSLLLSHCLEADSYNQRPELKTDQWLCVVQNNESNIPILYNSIQLEGTWSFNTSCTIPANGFSIWAKYVLQFPVLF